MSELVKNEEQQWNDFNREFRRNLDKFFDSVDSVLQDHEPEIRFYETGRVKSLAQGVCKITGLPGVKSKELVQFAGGELGIVLDLSPNDIGVALFDDSDLIKSGSKVKRTGRVQDTPVGENLLGRVIDPMGRPLDDKGKVKIHQRRPVEKPAPGVMERLPVKNPLQSGIKAIDALIPVGRGQRELIVGDRQTGKTAIAVDTIINQKDKNVICIYCAIGKRNSAVAKVVDDLKKNNAFDYTAVIVATGDDPPGLQFMAPYAATTLGEFFMEKGRDVLVVYDDITQHARAYRELSLLLRRPPGREAFPGDIFYIHSRMLERATHLIDELGGGSLTALPIVETQEGNISAYIPTNLISITDGQIYLSPDLFQKGVLPAIDIGESVSRVGGKTQLPAYRSVSGDLKLSYSQFEELEAFAQFGAQLEEETKQTLRRGRRVREVLKQGQYVTLPIIRQIPVLVAVTMGVFDEIPLEKVTEAEEIVRNILEDELLELADKIENGEKLEEEDQQKIAATAKEVLKKKFDITFENENNNRD